MLGRKGFSAQLAEETVAKALIMRSTCCASPAAASKNSTAGHDNSDRNMHTTAAGHTRRWRLRVARRRQRTSQPKVAHVGPQRARDAEPLAGVGICGDVRAALGVVVGRVASAEVLACRCAGRQAAWRDPSTRNSTAGQQTRAQWAVGARTLKRYAPTAMGWKPAETVQLRSRRATAAWKPALAVAGADDDADEPLVDAAADLTGTLSSPVTSVTAAALALAPLSATAVAADALLVWLAASMPVATRASIPRLGLALNVRAQACSSRLRCSVARIAATAASIALLPTGAAVAAGVTLVGAVPGAATDVWPAARGVGRAGVPSRAAGVPLLAGA